MTNEERLGRGARAKAILESDEWKEAWSLYRERIFEQMEKAGSNDVETVMHLKRLLASAKAAQAHFEALMSDGKVAAAEIELVRKKSILDRLKVA